MGDSPQKFAGKVTIEWPQPGPADALTGYKVKISTEDGTPVLTVTKLSIHAAADDIIWAEFEMFADPDGNPVLDTGREPIAKVHLDPDGEILMGTFPFLVTEMRVAAPAEITCTCEPDSLAPHRTDCALTRALPWPVACACGNKSGVPHRHPTWADPSVRILAEPLGSGFRSYVILPDKAPTPEETP